MNLVKLEIKEGNIYINPEQVQFVSKAFDERKQPVLGHAIIYTITEKILVKGSVDEIAAILDPGRTVES